MRKTPLLILSAAALVFALTILITTSAAAQQGPITPHPIIPTLTPTPVPVATLPAPTNDARGAICSAYRFPAFERYTIQQGDTLRELIGNGEIISLTDAAALNCIDDPDAPPVGAVIWLPGDVIATAMAQPHNECTYTWITGIENRFCPAEPALGLTGAVQALEHGMMMWIRETDEIWVLFGDGTAQIFANTYREGDANPVAIPPDGMEVPWRGFGAVWESLGGASSSLGWGITEEYSAQIERQPAGRISYTTYYRVNEYLLAITQIPASENSAGGAYWVDLTRR